MQEEERLSLREAAEALGISEVTARRWIKTGKLKAAQPGRKYLIPRSAVDDLLRADYPKGPQLDLESFLVEKTGHAYLATLSYEELHERAREEGQEFQDACKEERDAVLEERKQYPAGAGVLPLFTTGETHTDVQRRYFAVLLSNLSLEDAKREARQMAEATA